MPHDVGAMQGLEKDSMINFCNIDTDRVKCTTDVRNEIGAVEPGGTSNDIPGVVGAIGHPMPSSTLNSHTDHEAIILDTLCTPAGRQRKRHCRIKIRRASKAAGRSRMTP